MPHLSRTSARFALTVAVLFAALAPAPAAAEATGATIDKTGWWNRANTSTSTPAGPVTVPPPPGVPDGDLVVGATGSQASAITAVGIQPDDDRGATVEAFTMTVREDPDADGNQGTGSAAIVACPITSFWAGGDNGEWATRPEFDCDAASAPGVRADDGSWTFDLQPIAELWFDPFGTVEADGVVLLPAPDAPSFQAVFLGADSIDVTLESSPPVEDDDDFTTAVPEDPKPNAGLSSGPGGGGTSLFTPPAITSPPTTFAQPSIAIDDGPPPTVAPVITDDEESVALPAPVPASSSDRRGDLLGNLSPVVYLAFPVGLAVLLAMSYWLGPAGQPLTTVRQRGVSRALEARAAKGI